MDIEFSSLKLRKSFESVKIMKKEYGELTKKIQMAMFDLASATTMRDIALMGSKYKLHWLEGKYKNQMSMIIKLPHCLIVEPLEFVTKDFSLIDKIKIIGLVNYHEN